MLRGKTLIDGSGGLARSPSHDGLNSRWHSVRERVLWRGDADADGIYALFHGTIGEQLPLMSRTRQTTEKTLLTFLAEEGKGRGGEGGGGFKKTSVMYKELKQWAPSGGRRSEYTDKRL